MPPRSNVGLRDRPIAIHLSELHNFKEPNMKKDATWSANHTYLAMLSSFGATPVIAQEDGFTLTILHTNDTHSHIEQFAGSGARAAKSRLPRASASAVWRGAPPRSPR
jgi:hypothetical protein